MNDADPAPFNLDDLRLLPDWLRQEGPPPSKQYASHEGGDAGEMGGRRGPRPGAFNRDGGRGFGGGDRRRDGGSGGGGAGRRPGPGPRGAQGRPPRDDRRPAPAAPVVAAPVRVEFLPDEKCMASINKQIRSTHLAYPLFGLARMFLQEPARHWVQFTLAPEAASAGASLYQLGEDGPVVTDRAVLERIAFDTVKDEYYIEQSEQKEPPKGNFTNVARNRLSGALLGPTNYHGYQPALRAEYESKFSRRMSFEDYRRNVEVVSDPALVERWKEEARTTTTIATRDGEPPTVLSSPNEARAHFRQHHLDRLLRTGTSFKVHGSVARNLPEPSMMQAIRFAHDAELRYPAQFVQFLRQGLQDAGLHIFKHRKRVVYVSVTRPVPFAPHGVVSENVAAILETVRQFPLCTRKNIADKVLAAPAATAAEPATAPAENFVPETETPSANVPSGDSNAPVTSPADDTLSKARGALAADLRFLVQSGHLIEFHNGTFDLPLPPKTKEEPTATAQPADVPANPAEAETGIAPESDNTDVTDAESETPIAESIAMLPPDTSRASEPAPSLESGLEKIEAIVIDEPGHMDHPGIPSGEHHEISHNPVVVGDVESAHPLSPS